VFERFTADARQAVVNAQAEARSLGHGSIGDEHLLLGLLVVEHGAAARALAGLGLTPDRARDEVASIAGRGSQASHGQIPFNPRLRRTLDMGMREAMSLGHDEVGTEHLALALLADRDGIAGRVLQTVADPGVVRDAILEAMAVPSDGGAAQATFAPAVTEVPSTVTVVIGEEVRAVLRQAAALALADEAQEVGVEHLRRALEPGP
jgi:ATP-dependent Clp protease ATP-binding subunit ClpC